MEPERRYRTVRTVACDYDRFDPEHPQTADDCKWGGQGTRGNCRGCLLDGTRVDVEALVEGS